MIVAAAEEERFTRIKHDASFPLNAIQYCLREAGIEPEQVDQIALYEKPLLKFERILSTYLDTFPAWPSCTLAATSLTSECASSRRMACTGSMSADYDRERYHFRFDGHWNVAGNQRAAELMYAKIRDAGLSGGDPSLQRVEVLNAGMSGYLWCKELRVYQEIAKRFAPDLVVSIYTGSDVRNAEDADICAVDASGTLTIHERTYTTAQHVVRGIRSWIKTHSHFLTWVSDRFDTLPVLRDIRFQFMRPGDEVPYVDQPSPASSPSR